MSRKILVLAMFLAAAAPGRKFYDDDPLEREPQPVAVKEAKPRKLSDYFDILSHLFATPGELAAKTGKAIPAQGVNTLGEPMEGAWWEKRHYYRRMSLEELRRGPSAGTPPSEKGKWKVVGAKNEGITPGFVIIDGAGRRYFVKFDPLPHPEMATGADQISIKLFYALGYHVPDNYLVRFSEDRLELGEDVQIADATGKKRRMSGRDLTEILMKVPRGTDGKYRATASLAIAGKGLGPYRYYGQRADDPNDIVPHEHRRDLRGLQVFCAWLAHDDSRSINTYDALVSEGGVSYIKHYLLDLGSTLGSASNRANSPRSGGEYLFGWKQALYTLATLGLDVPDWARAQYVRHPAIGVFEGDRFRPETWVPEYPNPAFLNRLPDDTFWAAKQVMAFTDEELRAVVETAAYSDPKATEAMVEILRKRRDKIGRTYFGNVLPLDGFRVRGGKLEYDDLGARHGWDSGAQFGVTWHAYDNEAERAEAAALGEGAVVPVGAGYKMAEIRSASRKGQAVRVYVRGERIVGVERTWPDR
jgi:hypothetical protein